MSSDEYVAPSPHVGSADASRRSEEKDATWNDLVAPIVRRCKVAKNFNGRVYFDTDGADALATLLLKMADLLDREVAALKALDEPRGLSAGEPPGGAAANPNKASE
jgi:hypothetical protein